MAHDKHRPSVLAEYLFHFSQTFLLKIDVTHRQYFIDDENFWFKIRGYGESETHVHPEE